MAGFRINTQDGADLTAASLSFTGAGVNTLIAGVAGLLIRVYKLFLLSATGTTTIQFQDGGNNLTGAMTLNAGTPLIYQMDGNPWFTMTRGNSFNANISAGTQFSGSVYFTQQPLT